MRASLSLFDSNNAINVRAFEGKRISGEDITWFGNKSLWTRVRVRGALDTDKFTGQRVVIAHYLDKLPPEELSTDNCNEK